MDQIKAPSEFKLLVADPANGPDAWGTSAGIRTFSRISAQVARLTEGTVVVFDYAGIGRTDVSFQREAVVETIKRYRPRILFIASNVHDPDVLENLTAALEARGEALAIRGSDSPWVVGRRLAREYMDTLQVVRGRPGFTSSQLTAPPHGLESSTASARLTSLWKAGLLGRVQSAAPSGGREFRYFPIA